ncbi:MAG: hypothetical protein FWD80_00015 [Propionibacteriaceae bacterium]|nr:hypothetical protein [Propionibacteriaceae bacterium]
MTEICLARTGPITCHNYARRGFTRLSRGVYGHVSVDDPCRQQFLTQSRALTALSDGYPWAFYGPTALQIMGVALPSSVEDWDHCHIVVPRDAYRPKRAGLVVHETDDFRIWHRFDGLPVQNPVDHWVQLRGASADELIEVGDGLVRRQSPLMTIDQVNRRLTELSGVRGIDAVRKAMRWVMCGTDSLYETRVRTVMRHAGLPTPQVNLPVRIKSTGLVLHLDMGYEEEQVGLEYDGLVHVGDRRQMEIDALRHRDLLTEGWFVIKVTASQLRNPAQFLRPIERALIMRQHQTGR